MGQYTVSNAVQVEVRCDDTLRCFAIHAARTAKRRKVPPFFCMRHAATDDELMSCHSESAEHGIYFFV